MYLQRLRWVDLFCIKKKIYCRQVLIFGHVGFKTKLQWKVITLVNETSNIKYPRYSIRLFFVLPISNRSIM